jgi:glucose/arabinose dehydrogenase
MSAPVSACSGDSPPGPRTTGNTGTGAGSAAMSGSDGYVYEGDGMSPASFRPASLAVSLVVALALSACSSDREPATNPEDGAPRTAGTGGPGATLGEPTELVTGLEAPWGLTFLPDGSALVSERISGEIVRVPADGGMARTVGVVPDVVASSEGGLLGIVASRDFATDRTVYASVSGARENSIVALRIADDFGFLTQAGVLLDGIQTADRHHGGRIVIGPDGNLWIGTGDAFEPENAADDATLNGKISVSARMARSRPTTRHAIRRSTPPGIATSKASHSDRTVRRTHPSWDTGHGTR